MLPKTDAAAAGTAIVATGFVLSTSTSRPTEASWPQPSAPVISIQYLPSGTTEPESLRPSQITSKSPMGRGLFVKNPRTGAPSGPPARTREVTRRTSARRKVALTVSDFPSPFGENTRRSTESAFR